MKREIVSFILASMVFLSFQIASLNFPLSVGISYVREEADHVYIGNDLLEIGFSKELGAVISVLHKKSGVDLISSSIEREVWAVGMYSENRERFWTASQMSDSFTYSSSPLANGSQLSFQWANSMFGDGAPPSYQLEVRTNVTVLDTSPLSEWTIEVLNGGEAAIEYIIFPSISGIGTLGSSGEDDVLFSPTSSAGELRYSPYTKGIENYWFWGVDPPSNLRETIKTYGDPYPSMHFNMQFMAFYDDEAGFYLSCDDSHFFTKNWIVGVDNNDYLGFRPFHYSPLMFEEDYVAPYSMFVGVFDGDWYDAADLYNEWAHRQWWNDHRPTEPSWVRETQIGNSISFDWFDWNYSLLLECTKLCQQYYEMPLIVDLGYSWSPLDATGEIFPPYGGWGDFDRIVDQLHACGCRIAWQINPAELKMGSALWKSGEAEPFAFMGEDGLIEVWEDTVGMCFETEFWQQKLTHIILTLVEHGVDLIHFDGFPEGLPGGCYDSTHGHALSPGGNHCADAVIRFLTNITEVIRQINPDACLMGMGIAEISLPFVPIYQVAAGGWGVADWEWEGMPSSVVDDWEVIPSFQYIYDGNFVVAGHTGDFWRGKYDEVIVSRFLMWGMMPLFSRCSNDIIGRYSSNPLGTHRLHDLECDEMLKQVSLARATYGHDFLVKGERLKSLQIPCPMILVNGTEPDHEFEVERPALQQAAYHSIRGDLAFVFTNIGNETLTFDLDVNLSLFGMSEQNFAYFVRDGSYQTIGPILNQFNSTFQIEPREILLVVVTQDPVGKPDLWVSYCDLPYFGSELYSNRSTMNVTLWNTGPVDSGVFNISLLADWITENVTETLYTGTVDNIGPGEKVTLPVLFSSENAGDFELIVQVDPDDGVAEMNEANNEVNVKLKAGTWGLTDLNNDGTVNIVDISMVAVAFNSHPGDPNWNPIANIDNNEWVNIVDVAKVAVDYGKTL